jgi:O-succinylbenzoate synthase
MRIESLELRRVAMPLRETWSISVAEQRTMESVLLRIGAEGREAWAETTPGALPFYSADWAGATFLLLREIAPQILGRDNETAEDLQSELARYRGNPFARAGIDAAWWSLSSLLEGEPLHRALGARCDEATVGADFGVLDSVEQLIDRVEQAIDVGYTRVKLKVSRSWCLDVLAAVRSRFPSVSLHVDCNGAFTMADLDLLRAIDHFELAMIEQPLAHDDLVDHARLQDQLSTPVCLDESIASRQQLEQAIALGSCRAVNIKPGRVGGLTIARELIARSHDAGLMTWVGGMLESGIGAAICLALACLDGVSYPSDVFPPDRFYVTDLAQPPLEFDNDPSRGRIARANPQAGLAQSPDLEMLDACTVEKASFDLSTATTAPSRP